jgi:hypothetical protein
MRYVPVVVIVLSTVACSESGSPTSPASMMLAGRVTETVPTTSTPVVAATVTVIGGPDDGRSATSDTNGAFQLVVSRPQFMIRVQAPNYIERSMPVTLTQNSSLAIDLDPIFALVNTTKSNETITSDGNCPDWWSFLSPLRGIAGPCVAGYLVNVHHTGTLTAEITWTDRMRQPMFAVYQSSGGLPSGSPLPSQPPYGTFTGRVTADVSARSQYVLVVSIYDPGGGPAPAGTSSFALTLTHPN